MNYALIVYHNGLSCGVCEAVFKYKCDAETLAEQLSISDCVHTAVIRLVTGEVICEFET